MGPKAVAAILYELALDRSLADDTVCDGEIRPLRRVISKLQRETLLRVPRPSEDDEPARVLVDAMNDPEGRSTARALLLREAISNELIEGRSFFPFEEDGRNTCRLADDHDLRVHVDDEVSGQRPFGGFGRVLADLEGAPTPDFPVRNEADLAVHEDLSGLDPSACLAPGDLEMVPNHAIERGWPGIRRYLHHFFKLAYATHRT